MYKFSDNVFHRVIQIVQEAMLTGVDCADLLRQIRVEPIADNTLDLTSEYQLQVKEAYDKLLADAEKLAIKG